MLCCCFCFLAAFFASPKRQNAKRQNVKTSKHQNVKTPKRQNSRTPERQNVPHTGPLWKTTYNDETNICTEAIPLACLRNHSFPSNRRSLFFLHCLGAKYVSLACATCLSGRWPHARWWNSASGPSSSPNKPDLVHMVEKDSLTSCSAAVGGTLFSFDVRAPWLTFHTCPSHFIRVGLSRVISCFLSVHPTTNEHTEHVQR